MGSGTTSSMRAQEIIGAKRDGAVLGAAQIDAFVRGLTSRRWSEGQVAALAMAICVRGMTRAETVQLTRAMAASSSSRAHLSSSWPVLACFAASSPCRCPGAIGVDFDIAVIIVNFA